MKQEDFIFSYECSELKKTMNRGSVSYKLVDSVKKKKKVESEKLLKKVLSRSQHWFPNKI